MYNIYTHIYMYIHVLHLDIMIYVSRVCQKYI